MPTSLTRVFRPGLPTGSNGEQRAIRSNFSSGLGMNRQYDPTTPLAPPVAEDGAAPGATPQARPRIVTPVARDVAANRAAAMARSGTPNRGGTITRSGVTKAYAPTPGSTPNRPNMGGTMTQQLAPDVKAVTTVPPSPAAMATPPAPVISPTTTAAPQTEENNPLTGDGNAQPGGTTAAVNPGAALGLTQRGQSTPPGTDAMPQDENVGGTGLYARKFQNPKSASIYDSYVRKLFG